MRLDVVKNFDKGNKFILDVKRKVLKKGTVRK